MQFFVSIKVKIKEYFYSELKDNKTFGPLEFKERKDLTII